MAPTKFRCTFFLKYLRKKFWDYVYEWLWWMRSSTSLLSCVFSFYHQVCVWMQIKRKHLRGKNIASFLFKNVEMKIHDVIHLAIWPSTTRELCLAGDGGRFWGNPQKLQEVVVSHFMTAGHNEIRKTATTTKLWQFLREFACIVISLSQLHTATERAMETFENWNRGENASASKPTKRNGTRMQKAKQIPQ